MKLSIGQYLGTREAGFSLIELSIALTITAIITLGSIFTLRALRSTDDAFNNLANIQIELVTIETMLRTDLARARKTPNLEPFQDLVDGLNLCIANRDRLAARVIEALDGFYNRHWDYFQPMDDPKTGPSQFDTLFFGRTYNMGFPSDESKTLPIPNRRTPFNNAVVESVNIPYGPVYDYFGGILNNGMRDVLYFCSNVDTPSGTQPVAVAYRMVERSRQFNADRGSDGLASEFEPGYHPRYNVDPSADNAPSNRTVQEGDGILSRLEGSKGGAVDNRPLSYELERLVFSLQPNRETGGLRSSVIAQIVTRDIVEFNVFYWDRALKRYKEPDHLVHRFGYPSDFGSTVVGVGPQTFRILEPTAQSFLWDRNDPPRHIFLYQLNLDWVVGDPTSQLFQVLPRAYTVDSVSADGREITIAEPINPKFADPIRSVAGIGSVGYIDEDGILRSEAVRDGFLNLKPNDQVFVEQRPLRSTAFGLGRATVNGNNDPIKDSDRQTYLIRPGMYRVIEHRGEGIRLDLDGQQAKPGVPVVFRAPYFPPAIKIELTLGRDPKRINQTVPLVIRLPQD